MVIKNAEFIKSSASVKECPESGLPEYAFTGRSNVGKSSLINMLAGKQKLAKISSVPGKTQLINHYLINNSWYLTDLPGYGYTKTSREKRKGFSLLVRGYIEKRKNLTCLFLLVDSRHSPLQADLEVMQYLGMNSFPFVIVFTKCDKLAAGRFEKNLDQYLCRLKEDWETLPRYFCTSVRFMTGRDDILGFIDDTNLSVTVPREPLS